MTEGRSESGVQSVQLALDVLEAVAAAADDIGVSELAVRLEATKGTIFRHLQTLVERGYLTQSAVTARYRLGVRAHLLGQIASGRIDLLAASEAPVKALREAVGQTVVLSTVGARSVVVLSTVLGKSTLEIGVRPGSELQFHASAQGKAALAFSKRPLAAQLGRRPLERFTDHTVTDMAALEAELTVIRERGWAVAPEEVLLGINALAAPIFDETGDCAGVLALVGSIQFIGREPAPAQVEALRRAAGEISRALGGGPAPSRRVAPAPVSPGAAARPRLAGRARG